MATTNTSKKVYNIAILLYSGADILDVTGPIELLSHVTYNNSMVEPVNAFKLQLVARTPTVLIGGCMTVTADKTIEEAIKHIDDFDILVVPGGYPNLVQGLASEKGPEYQFVKDFTQLQQRGEDERVLLSVCTGALLVAATGAFGGLKATTHHLSYDLLKEMDKSIDVIKLVDSDGTRRYADGGLKKAGLRVVSAGGVSCGMDAALYVAELKVGREAAEFVAKMAEYNRKRVAA